MGRHHQTHGLPDRRRPGEERGMWASSPSPQENQVQTGAFSQRRPGPGYGRAAWVTGRRPEPGMSARVQERCKASHHPCLSTPQSKRTLSASKSQGKPGARQNWPRSSRAYMSPPQFLPSLQVPNHLGTADHTHYPIALHDRHRGARLTSVSVMIPSNSSARIASTTREFCPRI